MLPKPELPRYTAYAKIIQKHHGEQRVSCHKMKTSPLPPPTHCQENVRLMARLNTLSEGMIKERGHIEEEIRQRQEALKGRLGLFRGAFPRPGRGSGSSGSPESSK
jgi:hypothetical protein